MTVVAMVDYLVVQRAVHWGVTVAGDLAEYLVATKAVYWVEKKVALKAGQLDLYR